MIIHKPSTKRGNEIGVVGFDVYAAQERWNSAHVDGKSSSTGRTERSKHSNMSKSMQFFSTAGSDVIRVNTTPSVKTEHRSLDMEALRNKFNDPAPLGPVSTHPPARITKPTKGPRQPMPHYDFGMGYT